MLGFVPHHQPTYYFIFNCYFFMMLGSFLHPTVLVLGLGDSGLAMASWCARQGCELYLADTRQTPPNMERFDTRGIIYHALQCGPFTPDLLDLHETHTQQPARSIELIALSPGLSPLEPGLASLLEAAQNRGIPVWGELEFFSQALKALRPQGYAPKVLAITGTNGKTTTTALTGLLCKQAGLRTAIAGNIGPSLLDELACALRACPQLSQRVHIWGSRSAGTGAVLKYSEDPEHRTTPKMGPLGQLRTRPNPKGDIATPSSNGLSAVADIAPTLPEVWVLELSSFQLQATSSFCPDAGALLNMSVDHLDWHETFEAYAHAKARIFGPTASTSGDDTPGPQTIRILNRNDPHTLRFAQERDVARMPSAAHHSTVTFGLDAPQYPGDWGIIEAPTMTWLVRAKPSQEMDEPKKAIQIEYIIPANALRIAGRHNLANALAALALCSTLDVPLTSFLQGLREYPGEAHRFEHVASFDGLRFIDDSKATNVGATLAALNGLVSDGHQHVVLILGGQGKGQDFSGLVEPVAQTCKAVMLIGQAASDLRATLLPSGIPLYDCATLEEATRTAVALAEPGNTILLSPCCASQDMFRNYIHRAEVFRHMVSELAADSGVMV